MHRIPLPILFLLIIICATSLTAPAAGQSKPAGEVGTARCWTYPLGGAAGEKLASDASRVFLGLDGAKVEALSSDGQKMWSSEFGGSLSSNLLPLDGALFFATSTAPSATDKQGGNILRAVSKDTGITSWTVKLPDADKHYLSGFEDAVIVVSRSGIIQSVNVKTGAVEWRREIAAGFVTVPAFVSEKVIVATGANQIFSILLRSGQIDSLHKTPFGVTAVGEIGGKLLVGDERGNLSLFSNGTDKANWKFRAGGEILGASVFGDHILVTSRDDFLYFLADANGGVKWKKRLAERASGTVNVGDKYAFVVSPEAHGALLVDSSNGKVAGQVALGDDEVLVCAAATGNGLILVVTSASAYAYSLNGCSPIKNDGSDKMPAGRHSK